MHSNIIIKIGEFCVPILIFKQHKKQHSLHIMLYYFKKSENAAEMEEKKQIAV